MLSTFHGCRSLCRSGALALLAVITSALAQAQPECPPGAFVSFPPPQEAIFIDPQRSGLGSVQRAEFFSGITAPFDTLRWWGTGADGNFSPCQPTEFRIAILTNQSGSPGTLVQFEDHTPTIVPTGRLYDLGPEPFIEYQYTITLNTPVALSEGWIALYDRGGPCGFYWTDSFDGALNSRTCCWTPAAKDLAFCVSAACNQPIGPGARVRLIEDNPDGSPCLLAGALGTVICAYSGVFPQYQWLVEWDGSDCGHDGNVFFDACGTTTDTNAGWYVATNQIMPVCPAEGEAEGETPACLPDTLAPGGNLLFQADFEGDEQGFVLESLPGAALNLWHRTNGCRTADPAHPPGFAWYFGNTTGPAACTYAAGANRAAGGLRSPQINLGGATPPVRLHFWYLLETESNPAYDIARVQVSADGATFVDLATNGAALAAEARLCDALENGAWRRAEIDLSSHVGETIQLRFLFDSVDEGINHFGGWYIDQIRIVENAVPGVEGEAEDGLHSADSNGDGVIALSELLRIIQFFNSGALRCAAPPSATEDGYAPGPGDQSCAPHDADYNPQDWRIVLAELLRMIQFFNSGAYHHCPERVPPTEDGYCPGPA
jgi:hypothetical protein